MLAWNVDGARVAAMEQNRVLGVEKGPRNICVSTCRRNHVSSLLKGMSHLSSDVREKQNVLLFFRNHIDETSFECRSPCKHVFWKAKLDRGLGIGAKG